MKHGSMYPPDIMDPQCLAVFWSSLPGQPFHAGVKPKNSPVRYVADIVLNSEVSLLPATVCVTLHYCQPDISRFVAQTSVSAYGLFRIFTVSNRS